MNKKSSIPVSSLRLWKNIPSDSENTFHYLGKTLSYLEYEKLKLDEIEKFRKDLDQMYPEFRFNFIYTKYYNIAYRGEEKPIEEIKKSILDFFNYIYPIYFQNEPRWALRIVIFKNKIEFHSRKHHFEYGYYVHKIIPEKKNNLQAKTIFSYVNSGKGIFEHEILHGLVDMNLENKPRGWFNEGLASFYETIIIKNGEVEVGFTNWRLKELQEAYLQKRPITLKKFITSNNMLYPYSYSLASAFFSYLWMHEKLIPFVKSYLYDISPNLIDGELDLESIQKIEELLGKNMVDIEKEFQEFVMKWKVDQKLEVIKK